MKETALINSKGNEVDLILKSIAGLQSRDGFEREEDVANAIAGSPLAGEASPYTGASVVDTFYPYSLNPFKTKAEAVTALGNLNDKSPKDRERIVAGALPWTWGYSKVLTWLSAAYGMTTVQAAIWYWMAIRHNLLMETNFRPTILLSASASPSSASGIAQILNPTYAAFVKLYAKDPTFPTYPKTKTSVKKVNATGKTYYVYTAIGGQEGYNSVWNDGTNVLAQLGVMNAVVLDAWKAAWKKKTRSWWITNNVTATKFSAADLVAIHNKIPILVGVIGQRAIYHNGGSDTTLNHEALQEVPKFASAIIKAMAQYLTYKDADTANPGKYLLANKPKTPASARWYNPTNYF